MRETHERFCFFFSIAWKPGAPGRPEQEEKKTTGRRGPSNAEPCGNRGSRGSKTNSQADFPTFDDPTSNTLSVGNESSDATAIFTHRSLAPRQRLDHSNSHVPPKLLLLKLELDEFESNSGYLVSFFGGKRRSAKKVVEERLVTRARKSTDGSHILSARLCVRVGGPSRVV